MASASHAFLVRYLREWRNTGRILALQSRFKVCVIMAFAVAFELGLWLVFVAGFRFLDRMGGAGAMVMHRLFALYFVGMSLMLIISSLATAYASLFRAGDIPLLLTSPISISHIMIAKGIESAGLSSWAFGFIVIPFVAAYAWQRQTSLLFIVWTVLYSLPLLILCAAVGMLLALALARWYPQRRLVRRIITVAAVGGAAGLIFQLSQAPVIQEARGNVNLAQFVPGLRLGSHPLLPGRWVADGIFSMTNHRWLRGSLLWLTLTSSAVAAMTLVEWLGSHVFHTAWLRSCATGSRNERKPRLLMGLSRCLAPLPHDARALILKDVRTFFRDPIQWSQAVVFFGLLVLYFANLRSLNYHLLSNTWRNLIAFLNLFSVSAVLCSLGARFVFPQLSFEGQGFWLLGLSPGSLGRIVITKFMTGVVVLVSITLMLMHLSTGMLNTPLVSRLFIGCVSGSVALAICGLSTGLGAVFIDLHHRNPAAIVSGFGGTLNLVLCLAFTLAAVFPFAALFHLHSIHAIGNTVLSRGLTYAMLWLVGLTLTATVVPLLLGIRALKQKDF